MIRTLYSREAGGRGQGPSSKLLSKASSLCVVSKSRNDRRALDGSLRGSRREGRISVDQNTRTHIPESLLGSDSWLNLCGGAVEQRMPGKASDHTFPQGFL